MCRYLTTIELISDQMKHLYNAHRLLVKIIFLGELIYIIVRTAHLVFQPQ